MFVAEVYMPSHAPFVFETDFIPKARKITHDYSTKIILRDFNADQFYDSVEALFLRRFTPENHLVLLPSNEIHHTAHSDTALDFCLVNVQDRVIDFWEAPSPLIAGHDLTIASLNICTFKPTVSDFTYRDFKNVDVTALNAFFGTYDWSSIVDDDVSLEIALEFS